MHAVSTVAADPPRGIFAPFVMDDQEGPAIKADSPGGAAHGRADTGGFAGLSSDRRNR